MPPAPRKPARQPGGPPPRRRPVAGTRARRPAGTAEASNVDTETGSATTTDDANASTDTKAGTDTKASPDTKAGTDTDTKTPSKSKRSASTTTRPRPSPRPTKVDKEAPSRRSGRSLMWLPGGRVALSLAATAVVLAVVVTILGYLSWQQGQTDQARTDGLAAARSHAQTILSYDYRRIDADIAKAKKATTGRFTEEYAKTTSTVVKPTAVQYKAVVSAQVRAASVRSATPERVVVLLFVNQTTTSTRITGPKVDQSRVRMTLIKKGDEWLVSKIDAL